MKKLTVFLLSLLLLTSYFLLLTFVPAYAAPYQPPQFQATGLANEAETLCYPMDLWCDGSKSTASCNHQVVNTYFLEKGGEEFEMREDAQLDQGSSAKGIHCGITKSTPLVLNETSTYCLGDAACYWPGWIREVRMNYTPFTMKDNLQVPFAEQMARQWAGTMDTEHLTPMEFDNLIARANVSTTQAGINTYSGAVSYLDKIKATNEINQRTGALQKLLSQDDQDELKCNFVKWTHERRGSQRPTIYSPQVGLGFKPDGKTMIQLLAGNCRNEICPATMRNRGACLSSYDKSDYGNAWSKLSLFPNDKSTGTLYFDVFDDKTYQLDVMYPELMKLGLSANMAFRIFTPYQKQQEFYALPYYDNLKGNPLDKNQNSMDPIWQATLGTVKNNQNINDTDYGKTASSNIQNDVQTPFLKAKSAILTKDQNVNSNKSIFHLIGEKIKSWPIAKITNAVSIALDKTLEKNGMDLVLNDIQEKVVTVGDALSNPANNGNLLATIGQVLSASNGGGRRCVKGQCCVTAQGTADCGKPCQNTRKGPSMTTVWPRTYPAHHVVLGVDWDESGPDDYAMVRYFYKDGMGGPTNALCGNSIIYSISQKRVVDVYNKVPYLASVWMQTNDPIYGFEANIRPFNSTGAGIKEEGVGCTNNQDNVLDQNGNYVLQNAHMVMNYDFGKPMNSIPDDLGNAQSIEVGLDYANPNNLNAGGRPYQGKITFYRLAGVCNANKWWSERVLNPLLKTVAAGGTNAQAPDKRAFNLSACKGKGLDADGNAISPTSFYSWDTCKKYEEPRACEDYRGRVEGAIDQAKRNGASNDQVLDAAREASNGYDADVRMRCMMCPDGTGNRMGGNCGIYFTTFTRPGANILNGNFTDSVYPIP